MKSALHQQDHGCQRKRNENPQAQIGEGIVIAADLILYRQQAAPLYTAHPDGIPQRVEVQTKVTVQCLASAGGVPIEKPESPPGSEGCRKVGGKVEGGHGKTPPGNRILCQQSQRYGVGHGQEIGMYGDGGYIQHKQTAPGHSVMPPAFKIAVESGQNEKLCSQGGMAKDALKQYGTGNKQEISQNRQKDTAGKAARQQGTEGALQKKAQQREQPEILAGIRQQRRKNAKHRGKQRYRVGVGDADPVRVVEVLGKAEWKSQIALPVEQPACIMLLDVLFDVSAAAERVVGHIQRSSTVYQKKYKHTQQTACEKKHGFSVCRKPGHQAQPPPCT